MGMATLELGSVVLRLGLVALQLGLVALQLGLVATEWGQFRLSRLVAFVHPARCDPPGSASAAEVCATSIVLGAPAGRR